MLPILGGGAHFTVLGIVPGRHGEATPREERRRPEECAPLDRGDFRHSW